MQLSVPTDKRHQIKQDIITLLATQRITLRMLYRILGKLNALTTIVRSLRYHCSSLASLVSKSTRQNCAFDSEVPLPLTGREDLIWWSENLDMIAVGPIKLPLVSLEITTDSSLKGWGAWCGQRASGGTWNIHDQNLHINALELKAIFLAVQKLADDQKDTTIAIRTDNTTAMHCVNNFGSLHSSTLNSLTRSLWAWAFERNIFLKATHIPGTCNDRADLLSRTTCDNHSFSLHDAIFKRLDAAQGPFDIDLFADFTNYKIIPYISWIRDPFALSMDAFLSKWDMWNNLYAFPPFKL
ncbi:uncharacterized protein LOC108863859, partial [Galendromus occidentalis]